MDEVQIPEPIEGGTEHIGEDLTWMVWIAVAIGVLVTVLMVVL